MPACLMSSNPLISASLEQLDEIGACDRRVEREQIGGMRELRERVVDQLLEDHQIGLQLLGLRPALRRKRCSARPLGPTPYVSGKLY